MLGRIGSGKLGSVARVLRYLAGIPSLMHMRAEIEAQRHAAELLGRPRHADPRSLARFEQRTYSQSGEDGIIAEILRRSGSASRYFVEFGAGNGLENNTAALLLRRWRGLWIEANRSDSAACRQSFAATIASGDLTVCEEMLNAENVEPVFRRAGVPAEPDVLSIDIDGNDYWVWKAISSFSPRLVVIEYNGYLPADLEWVVTYQPDRAWRGDTYFGASLKALEKLGTSKGYRLVGCTLAGTNAFFVRSDLVGEAYAGPFTAEHMWEPIRPFLATYRGLPRAFGPFVSR